MDFEYIFDDLQPTKIAEIEKKFQVENLYVCLIELIKYLGLLIAVEENRPSRDDARVAKKKIDALKKFQDIQLSSSANNLLSFLNGNDKDDLDDEITRGIFKLEELIKTSKIKIKGEDFLRFTVRTLIVFYHNHPDKIWIPPRVNHESFKNPCRDDRFYFVWDCIALIITVDQKLNIYISSSERMVADMIQETMRRDPLLNDLRLAKQNQNTSTAARR